MRDELPTQRLSRLSNQLLDQHMLERLLAAHAEHPRVFATVGVSHAVMLEPALRAAAMRSGVRSSCALRTETRGAG